LNIVLSVRLLAQALHHYARPGKAAPALVAGEKAEADCADTGSGSGFSTLLAEPGRLTCTFPLESANI
jgi:hypothetical protein